MVGALLALWLTGCINTKPRPISITCGMSKGQFVRRCTALLIENNYQIIEADSNVAVVQATRRQQQTNIGENIQYNGPYLFTATYNSKGGNIIVDVATTMRRGGGNGDAKPLILQTHGEGSGTSAADRKAFEPILNGLRQSCGQR
jgi:hypothetical protein